MMRRLLRRRRSSWPSGRCPAQAGGIRRGDLAGVGSARARFDEDVPGARRRGLSRPVAEIRPADRFEGCAHAERAIAGRLAALTEPKSWTASLAPQVEGGGAKKQRRLPSGRLQRQNSPSGEGWASANGTASYIDGPMPASGPWMIT